MEGLLDIISGIISVIIIPATIIIILFFFIILITAGLKTRSLWINRSSKSQSVELGEYANKNLMARSGVWKRRRAATKSTKGSATDAREKEGKNRFDTFLQSKAYKYFQTVSISLIAVFSILLVLVNFVFFEQSFGWALKKIKKKTAIDLSYKSYHGDLFSREFYIKGLHVRRTGHEYSDFDIKIDQAKVRINRLSSLFGLVEFDNLLLKGVQGRYIRLKKRRVKKTDFLIRHLGIDSLNLIVEHRYLHRPDTTFNLFLDKVTSKGFSKRFAAFDLFFRSDVVGRINNAKFEFETSVKQEMRTTLWTIKNISAQSLRHISGKSLLWLKSGVADVKLKYRFHETWSHNIESRCQLHLKNVFTQIPEGTGKIKSVFYKQVVKFFRNRYGDVISEFKFKLSKDDFDGHTSLDIKKFWKAVIRGLLFGRVKKRSAS